MTEEQITSIIEQEIAVLIADIDRHKGCGVFVDYCQRWQVQLDGFVKLRDKIAAEQQRLTKAQNMVNNADICLMETSPMGMSNSMSMLHADLQAHLHAGVLRHPLVIVDDFGERFVSLANRKYLNKREELERAEQAGDWKKYIWLHVP